MLVLFEKSGRSRNQSRQIEHQLDTSQHMEHYIVCMCRVVIGNATLLDPKSEVDPDETDINRSGNALRPSTSAHHLDPKTAFLSSVLLG